MKIILRTTVAKSANACKTLCLPLLNFCILLVVRYFCFKYIYIFIDVLTISFFS